MLLEDYLRPKRISTKKIAERLGYSISEIAQWDVLEYPDELLYVLSRQTRKKISVLLYELLYLENKIAVRRVSGDYSLLRAIESKAPVIFIDRDYRKTQTQFLTDVLVEKNIYELELGPLAKFNLIGQAIYLAFLKSVGRSEEFKRIETHLSGYFVLVHDAGGSLLCLTSYLRKKEWRQEEVSQ